MTDYTGKPYTICQSCGIRVTREEPLCQCVDVLQQRIAELEAKNSQLSKMVRSVAHVFDPECPDADAYLDGHCSVEELCSRKGARIAELESRIRELTEWRPMSEAPRGYRAILVREDTHTINIWMLSDECPENMAGEGLGWLPLPEVKP